MRWNETEASHCRYGEIAERLFGEAEIVWEDSEADYQGHAHVLAKQDGKYGYYEWSYGSCSGCDAWEAAGATDDAVEAEMREQTRWMDRDALKAYGEALPLPDPDDYWNHQKGLKEAIYAELGLEMPKPAEPEKVKPRFGP